MKKIMKKIILSFVFAMMSLVSFGQDNFTSKSEVVQCEGMSIETIYGNIMQNWTTINGANIKVENQLDYCDKESGIINIKTKIYLGFHKCNIAYGYDGYANALITYKIKDGRYKVTLTTNTVTFIWSGDHSSETFNINQLYPEYIVKTKLLYIKKSSNDLVLERMPNIVGNYFKLLTVLHNSNEDDF